MVYVYVQSGDVLYRGRSVQGTDDGHCFSPHGRTVKVVVLLMVRVAAHFHSELDHLGQRDSVCALLSRRQILRWSPPLRCYRRHVGQWSASRWRMDDAPAWTLISGTCVGCARMCRIELIKLLSKLNKQNK